MLRYAIPDYRLPPEVLERELKLLEKLGINFRMNHRFGSDTAIDELKAEGFNAILIAAGTSVSKPLPIENSDLEGILPGLEFLRSIKISQEPRPDGQVVVIGGGNVAIDAAMTAVRLGAQEVNLVCLEARNEMPAHEWEIAQAEEESIGIHTSWGPRRFTSQNGRVSGVELKKCTRVFDEQGRFDPQYDDTETQSMPADWVIVTIGQEIDGKLFSDVEGLRRSSRGTIEAGDDFAVGIDGVFAAGDIVRGPSSVVDAMADGRRVAEVIDKYLGGKGLPDISPPVGELDDPRLDSSSDDFQCHRQMAETADPETRKSGFGLLEGTFQEKAARLEARRCLQCHLRQMITPVTLPPEPWLPLSQEAVESVPGTEGVFQLLDAEKKVIRISGTANMHDSLAECLENPGEAKYFIYEEHPMYTQRESQLIQQYLQEHGELPGGGAGADDLDDLF
jgi:NADPH-dependent glutamate synthase beta subunit-like oxidoreductase